MTSPTLDVSKFNRPNIVISNVQPHDEVNTISSPTIQTDQDANGREELSVLRTHRRSNMR